MSNSQWLDVAAVAEVPDGDVLAVEVDALDIALFKVGGEVFAIDNLCTHGNARLCDGFVDGYEVECPLHQGKFDVRTGQPTCAPVTEAVVSYPVRIDQGRVYLDLGF